MHRCADSAVGQALEGLRRRNPAGPRVHVRRQARALRRRRGPGLAGDGRRREPAVEPRRLRPAVPRAGPGARAPCRAPPGPALARGLRAAPLQRHRQLAGLRGDRGRHHPQGDRRHPGGRAISLHRCLRGDARYGPLHARTRLRGARLDAQGDGAGGARFGPPRAGQDPDRQGRGPRQIQQLHQAWHQHRHDCGVRHPHHSARRPHHHPEAWPALARAFGRRHRVQDGRGLLFA
mmetsp:Transcript_57943/g.163613  ORF Transcript_57943/g.163613 Transcript_57943/m.163613 type:complete len:234 (+) Transcript_57943:824-1525(+)